MREIKFRSWDDEFERMYNDIDTKKYLSIQISSRVSISNIKG